jgi:hypothetical protein
LFLAVPLSYAQVAGSSTTSPHQPERLYGLSAWYGALDGFLAGITGNDKPEAAYKTWEKWSPGSKHPSLPEPPLLLEPSPDTPVESAMIFRDSVRQALDELALISFGASSSTDGLIHISRLPGFISAAAALMESHAIHTLADAAELHGGANPLRVVLAFLSTLNVRDREAFRLLAGIELAEMYKLLDFSGLHGRMPDTPDTNHADSAPDLSHRTSLNLSTTLGPQYPGALEPRQLSSTVDFQGLLAAERLLVSWRSSRLRSSRLQPGSLSHTIARSDAGKFLATLLATEYGSRIFNPGWAGETFADDAKRDLNEAWLAIGRAVAIDLRREAAPWLARRLGTSSIPSFSLEYTVMPSPSNEYLALMTIRAVVTGVSYGIPYQVAARALASASAVYFGDAPVPLRYVEEPLPGLRIYVARDEADSSRAITELAADLSGAYPAALWVPPLLLHIPVHTGTSCEEVCIALDGAYREAATGAILARSFTAILHDRGYPALDSLILRKIPITAGENPSKDSTHETADRNAVGGADS